MMKIKSCRCLYYKKTRRYLLLLLLCQSLFHTSQSQSRKLDSINELIIKAKSDTSRIMMNIKKIEFISRSNLDSGIELARQQLKEAFRLNFYNGIVGLHNDLASNYTFKGNFDSTKQQIQFLEKYIKPGDSLNLAIVYADYGMMYGVQAKYDSSIIFYGKAIGVDERWNSMDRLPADYTNISIGYQQLANLPKCLEYQQKALTLLEKQKNEHTMGTLLVNMGNTYEMIGDTLKAEQSFLKAGDMAIKTNSKIIELYAYTNLSTLYLKVSKWNKGYDFAMKAAALAVTTGDVGIQGASLAKAAIALANQNRFEEATRLSERAILLVDSSGQPLNISQGYGAMGSILYLQKKYKEAIPYYEKEFKALSGSPNYDHEYVLAYKDLSECYEKIRDYPKALANYKISAEMADSISRKDNIRKVTELSMNYDFAKKQEVLAAEKKKDEDLAKAKQLALVIGLLFVLILAIVAFTGYRGKQKANELLTTQKEKIESTLSDLKDTQAQLIQSEKMASLGELTAGIAHEIQNPLNFVNNFSEVNKELVDELQTELKSGNAAAAIAISDEIKGNEEKINHHGKRAGAIVKGMLQHSRKDAGQAEPTNVNGLANEYLRLAYYGIRAKDSSFVATMQTDFDQSVGKIKIVPQDIGRVLLNLFNNALYAVNDKKKKLGGELAAGQQPYEPTVSLQTKRVSNKSGDDRIEISVKDNGNGVPKNVFDKIFQPFFTTKPPGDGTGLGLSLSYDIVKAHGGEIKVQTQEGEGTEFIVSIPAV